MFKKKILPIIIFMVLLLGMAGFSALPILIFKIPIDEFGLVMEYMYYFFCDVVFIIILFLLYKNKIKKDFKEYFKNFWKNFEESFKYYFIGLIVMIVSNLIITFFITEDIAGNEDAVRKMINLVPLYMLFSVSFYAPFVEELIFRHSIKDCVMCHGENKLTKGIYIFISGFIFALLHIIGQNPSLLDYIYLIPYMSLGVAFAALYSKTDNIFSSISMHCLHNTFTIILYFIAGGAI